MISRFRPILVSAFLAAVSCQLACAPYTPVSTPRGPRDHVVESCQLSVRDQLSERFGGSTRVRFDSPQTYYISTNRQGVRGGGLVDARAERSRIHYDCTVNIHSGRVVSADHRLIDAERRRSEWSVNACQDRIRHDVGSGGQRHAALKFDPAETWFISLQREGVKGEAQYRSGKDREKIRYECEVDIWRHRIAEAHYRSVEKPPMSDQDALQLCQGKITDDLKDDRGRRTKVSFKENTVYSISRTRKGIEGRAGLKSATGHEIIDYECTVNTRRERVTDADYRVLERPGPPRKRVVEMCRMVTREMVAADHGRRAKVDFDVAETFAMAKREIGVRGSGRLRVGNRHDPIRYRCRVDLRTSKVTDARYRAVKPPQQSTQRSIDLCRARLLDKISSDRNARASLSFENTETYFVSTAVEGVRGNGVAEVGRGDRDRIRFECEVNIRRGRVKEARYHYR